MKRVAQPPKASTSKALWGYVSAQPIPYSQKWLHTTPAQPATVAPITASGPPPTVPLPSAEHESTRVARRRKQAELLKRGQDLRAVAAGSGGGSAKTKRFWKDVHVVHADGK
jgi:ATP synthase F1 complex assembly factor 2